MSVVAWDRKIVVNAEGEPTDVIIPYAQYIEFVETYGLNLTEEDESGIREAEEDLAKGNSDAFVSFDEVKREFGCTK